MGHRPPTQLPHPHATARPRAEHQDLHRRQHRGRRHACGRTRLAEPELPTAIIAFNDRSAVGLIFGLRDAGVRVPEDISVVGYDDIPLAALPFIDLSTVGQDSTATARCVVEQVAGRLEARAPGGANDSYPPTSPCAAPPRHPHTIYPNTPLRPGRMDRQCR